MKIGFDAKRAFCNFRGLGNYSRNTIAALTRYRTDNEYYLFTPKISKEFQGLAYPNASVITPQSPFARALPTLWRTHSCLHDINSLNLDIFHGLSHELPLGIGNSKTKSVVTMHDLIFITHPQLYPLIDRKTYTLKYRHSCNVADRIIAISRQTKSDLINYWNIPEEKIDVVYQGCNPVFYEPATQQEKDEVIKKYNLPNEYLLHVGAIERRKNQELILQAMQHTEHDIPLVMVGKASNYLQSLQNSFPELFKNRVIILNNVTDKELRSIYASASIFIYPSLYEGFGIPILEALSCGVPVITTDNGCFREAGGSACQYIDPSDHNHLAEKISLLLSDSDLRKACRNLGMEHIKQFSEEKIAQNLSKIYESIL